MFFEIPYDIIQKDKGLYKGCGFMAIEINKLDAGRVLRESYERVLAKRQVSCKISQTVDITLEGKGCLTYRYILLTALVAKLTNPMIDMLSLQVEDTSSGCYAPRTLCAGVIYPFQKQILHNALDGSNPDPLVNKPARYLRLSKSNAARGDGRIVLDRLCDTLPTLNTVDEVRDTLDYMLSKLLVIAEENQERKQSVKGAIQNADAVAVYSFLSDLLDQGFGGAALLLASYALFLINFPPENGYKIIPHPVNQAGTSSKQKSDLDIELNGKPFLGVELKDKPFTSDDVARAADTAMSSGLKSLLFVSGRHAGIQSISTYFSEIRKTYAKCGFSVGVIDIDEFMDFVLVTHPEIANASQILSNVYDCVAEIGGTAETQTWVYSKLRSL